MPPTPEPVDPDDIDAPDEPVPGAEDLPDDVRSGNPLAGEED